MMIVIFGVEKNIVYKTHVRRMLHVDPVERYTALLWRVRFTTTYLRLYCY